MSEFMSLIQTAVFVVAAIVVVLWILTIIWVVRDAPSRGVSPVKWGIIAIIPFIGALIYCAMRPSLAINDREDQELDMLLKQRELMRFGECGRCSYPVQDDYIACPNCGSQLKVACTGCGKPLDPRWNVCPWCNTHVAGRGPKAGRRARSSRDSHDAEAAGEDARSHQDRTTE